VSCDDDFLRIAAGFGRIISADRRQMPGAGGGTESMVADRARVVTVSGLLASLLVMVWAAPVSAACALSAPDYVNVGTELTIEGSGFPASASVDIALSIEGGASDAFTAQADASGGLQIALTPETIDIGATTLIATAGSTCTAEVTYTVLAAGVAPPSEPEPEATEETDTPPSAPQTDSATRSHRGDATNVGWLLAIGLVTIGSLGLVRSRLTGRG
jgi:hypothetical protein